MAESLHMGSGGNRRRDAPVTADGAILLRQQAMMQRPSSATPKLALSHPDRRGGEAEPAGWKTASLKHELIAAARPGSARPALRVTGSALVTQGDSVSPTQPPPRVFGRLSLYDLVDDNKEAHSCSGEQADGFDGAEGVEGGPTMSLFVCIVYGPCWETGRKIGQVDHL